MGHARDHDATSPLDADFGDVLSFYQRLRERVEATDLGGDGNNAPDLYLVMNGDFLRGTLLGADPPRSLPSLLARLPYDAVAVGEHDLADAASLAVLRAPGGLLDGWGDRLVTSNVRVEDESGAEEGSVPLGCHYRLLRGRRGTVLVLGFLYDGAPTADDAPGGVVAERARDALARPWFATLLGDDGPDFDAVLVLVHADAEDGLVALLLEELRRHVGPGVAVQFVAGHTHRRAYRALDDRAAVLEAGRFLDTIGYLGFDPDPGAVNATAHAFVDGSRRELARALGHEDGTLPATPDGADLSGYIRRTLEHAGGTARVGCAPARYRADGGPEDADSLERLFLDRVLPAAYLRHRRRLKRSSDPHHHHAPPGATQKEAAVRDVFVQHPARPSAAAAEAAMDAIQYDLFPGAVTLNDVYGVVPVDDALVKLGRPLRGNVVLDIVREMREGNGTGTHDSVVGVAVASNSSLLPPYGIQNASLYTLHTLATDAEALGGVLKKLNVPPAISTFQGSKSRSSQLRSLWIDFIKNEWPYDGNDCLCLKDEEKGCRQVGGAEDTAIATAPTTHDSDEDESLPGTAHATPEDRHGSGGPSTEHVSHTSAATNSTRHGRKGGAGRPGGGAGPAAFWAAVVVAAAVLSFVLRRAGRRRRRDPREVQAPRRSELEGSHDLELQESTAAAKAYGASAGGGYSSPEFPTAGLFV